MAASYATTMAARTFHDALPTITHTLAVLLLADMSAALGLVALVLGVPRYGLLFLPLVLLAALRPQLVQQTRAWALLKRLPASALYVLVAAFGVAHWVQCMRRYDAFYALMDMAIYGNACKGALYSTAKGDVSLLADHFEPLLIVLTPFCQWLDPARVLITASVAAWCIGAIGAHRLARAVGWSEQGALLAALVYLQLSGLVTTVYYDFHLIVLMLGLTPWLWFALLTERYVLFWLLALASLGLKESTSLSLVGLGAYLISQRRRIQGTALIVVGATAFVLIMRVVYPHLRSGAQDFYFGKYYAHLGSSLGEFVHTAVARPGYFLSTFLQWPKLRYLAALLLPFLFVHLRAPATLLAVAPAVFINVASNDPNLISGRYHYEADIWPTLYCTALFISRLRILWMGVLLVAFTSMPRFHPEATHRRIAERLALVPMDAKVTANHALAAHLTSRPKLYLIEQWQDVDIIAVAYPRDDAGWMTAQQFERKYVARFATQFDLVHSDPFFRMWRRRSAGPKPAGEAGAQHHQKQGEANHDRPVDAGATP